jgi:hypothetical protein
MMVWQVSQEQQDSLEQQVLLDRKEIKDREEVRAQLDHRDQLVRQVPSGRQGHLVTVDLQDHRVKREQLDQQDIVEIQVCREILVQQV